MSYKEVNELRKSGRLSEAIDMARKDLENKRDHWSCSALFLCLNDLNKTTNALSEKECIVTEMHELAEGMNPGDFVTNTLRSADASILPHRNVLKEAEELSKNGNALKGWQMVKPLLEAKEFNTIQHEQVGWIIYRVLKQNQEWSTLERKKLLGVYFKLETEKPSLLHSCILGEAISTNKSKKFPNDFLFCNFVEMWNLSNLQDDDWKDGITAEGNRYGSRAEHLITQYTKELSQRADALPTAIYMTVVKRATEKWPENENLLRDYAIALCKQGKKEEAKAMYNRLVVVAPQKVYLWNGLAELEEEPNLKASLLCKALSFGGQEDFLGKIHTSLAELLIKQGKAAWALAELDKVKALYTKKNWKLKEEYHQVARLIPAGTVAAAEDYKEHTTLADSLVYSKLPSTFWVKTGENTKMVENRRNGKPKKITTWFLAGKNGAKQRINPKVFGLAPVKDGQFFEAKVEGDRVRHIVLCNDMKTDWLKKAKGSVRIKTNAMGKRFGFVDEYYIHEKYLKDIADGDILEVVAIKDDKWQCISVKKV